MLPPPVDLHDTLNSPGAFQQNDGGEPPQVDGGDPLPPGADFETEASMRLEDVIVERHAPPSPRLCSSRSGMRLSRSIKQLGWSALMFFPHISAVMLKYLVVFMVSRNIGQTWLKISRTVPVR